MKRQRSMVAGKGMGRKKKERRVIEEEKEVVVEERMDGGEGVVAAAAAAAEEEKLVEMEEEEWPYIWLWSVVDEQMTWGTFWFPWWDMEFMGEAYNNLYSDVAWDDDIWDLRAINEVPNP